MLASATALPALYTIVALQSSVNLQTPVLLHLPEHLVLCCVLCLAACRIMIEGRCAVEPELCSGCASPYAFETALRLLEIEEEIVGARMTRNTSQGVCSSWWDWHCLWGGQILGRHCFTRCRTGSGQLPGSERA